MFSESLAYLMPEVPTMGNMTVNVKGAVALAVDYVQSLSDFLPVEQLRLEEVERNKRGRWLITLSYPRAGSLLLDKRDYKTFEIDPEKKEVVAMRIRTPSIEAYGDH